ncbi:Porphobilinogen deaminase [Carbonactinospora thermoautotrophica]|uniref:Porphobilinogen deaminase n=1 Tax=Carbonactinospora thermoautotrophica TaxID=1469144 RepID=A0A132MYD6_9ACTN|nr:hydroxymethylbilane synthase [Carbonactinospora thermoautotrophica]KWX02834.1 Porphobilinogen deaminase [Carbonactinospora thermoautotrophica]
MSEPLKLGTRKSSLAMAQARAVAEAITARSGREVELVGITTYGDTTKAALAQIGGTGVFVNALRDALLEGRIDLAVHSLKDLPTTQPDGLVIAAVPPREDPRDALCARDGRKLTELSAGARVGTGSPRRAAQLRALGYGLVVVAIRGNVDTRLRYVAEGELDAVVLARAGLARLGRLDAVTEVFDPMQMLPAPGQGALAVECRAGHNEVDAALVELLRGLDDPDTRAAVTAERALLAALEAGCSAPVGAFGEVAEGEEGPELYLRGVVVASDGSQSVRLSATGTPDEADQLGRRLAAEMLAAGAAGLMGERVP